MRKLIFFVIYHEIERKEIEALGTSNKIHSTGD